MESLIPTDALTDAQANYRNRNFDKAEATCRQLLVAQPSNADALHLLGCIASERGNYPEAVRLLREAIRCRPDFGDAYFHLGLAWHRAERLVEAIEAYRWAIVLNPKAHVAYSNLAEALRLTGKLHEARAVCRHAIELAPEEPIVHVNFSAVMNELGEHAEAEAAARRALLLRPDYPQACLNLCNALRALGRTAEAEQFGKRAVALSPKNAVAYNSLGAALHDLGRYADAEREFRKAITIDPNYALAHGNLAAALKLQRKLGEAEASFRRAFELDPESSFTKWNFALFNLLRGNYEAGFAFYEGRLDAKGVTAFEFARRYRNGLTIPEWRGEIHPGRRLLIWSDQGLGDAVMMFRYFRLLAERGFDRNVVCCERPLFRLAALLPGVTQVIDHTAPVPSQLHAHCPFMSLPHRFGTRLETIPATIPYLEVPPGMGDKWAARLKSVRGMKVGVVWQGGKHNPRNPLRSIPPHQFAPLWKVKGVQFVSLQKDATAPEPALLDWMSECGDLLDTAALIDGLDLVITVDTAVAHLAGALGKTVWLMNSFESEWRWMIGREESLWYPTMRIFNQPRSGDWVPVVERVAAELAAQVARQPGR